MLPKVDGVVSEFELQPGSRYLTAFKIRRRRTLSGNAVSAVHLRLVDLYQEGRNTHAPSFELQLHDTCLLFLEVDLTVGQIAGRGIWTKSANGHTRFSRHVLYNGPGMYVTQHHKLFMGRCHRPVRLNVFSNDTCVVSSRFLVKL